jgi:phosphohistidine phosphatase SixA
VNPIRVLVGALLALTLAGTAHAACPAAAVHLLRHAEKAGGSEDPDPGLSDRGRERAAALVQWFEDHAVDAVYATHLRRTQHTALPLALARDLDLRVLPAGATPQLIARLRERHCGEQVVVVGHSNTVPEIAAAFGAEAFAIAEDEYGWIYRVVPASGALRRDRFGAAPAAER